MLLKAHAGLLLMSLVSALLFPAPGWAREPSTGTGLFVGNARHVGTVRLTRPQAREIDYVSEGFLVGLDWVFWSVSYFSVGAQLMGTHESSDEFTEKIVHGRLALQFRFWFRQVFLGFQGGQYSLAFTEESTKERVSGNGKGDGYGVLAGWEGDSGWFVTAQLDKFEIDMFDGTSTENGVTTVGGNTTEEGLFVYVGFRWH